MAMGYEEIYAIELRWAAEREAHEKDWREHQSHVMSECRDCTPARADDRGRRRSRKSRSARPVQYRPPALLRADFSRIDQVLEAWDEIGEESKKPAEIVCVVGGIIVAALIATSVVMYFTCGGA